MPTLAEMLDTSDALEEKLASSALAARDGLRQKKSYVDFAAFGAFKQANFWPAAKQALGWGVGLGVPALGAGLLLEHNAKNNAKDVIDHARNQVLMAGLGLGASALGAGALSGRTSLGADESEDLRKLAAALLLDDVLLQQLSTPSTDKVAVEACLRLNREHGTSLLRKLRR